MIRRRILDILNKTLEHCRERGLLQVPVDFEPQVEVPKNEAHGDFATTLALSLAGPWHNLYWQDYTTPKNARHGCIIQVTKRLYDQLMATYTKAGAV